MKKTLLTCCIVAAILGQALAQGTQITASAFSAEVNSLNNAIDKKDLAGENSAFSGLNGMMNSQMLYISSIISLEQTKYTADTASAGRIRNVMRLDSTKAQADYNSAQTATSSAAAAASLQAYKDEGNAFLSEKNKRAVALDLAQQEMAKIKYNSANLATEQNAYKALQPLKNVIIPNRGGIMNNLKLFASTLQ
jgi:hypothetical protein